MREVDSNFSHKIFLSISEEREQALTQLHSLAAKSEVRNIFSFVAFLCLIFL